MLRSKKLVFLLVLSILLLAACSQSFEDRISEGLEVAEKSFQENNQENTEEIDGVSFYKPKGFIVKDDSDPQNIILEKGKSSFFLFINPNETKESRLFYDLLKNDQNSEVIAEKQFQEEDAFGFVAVIEQSEKAYELIASVGGIKITTITEEKNIADYLKSMMQIVRSID